MAEFLRQSNKIRHAVSGYLTATNILNVLKTRVVYPESVSTDEEKAVLDREQHKKNVSDALDIALDTNAEKTVEILGLLCFKEGKEVEEMEAVEFLDVALDVLSSERVVNFFMKLMRSGLIDTANTLQI